MQLGQQIVGRYLELSHLGCTANLVPSVFPDHSDSFNVLLQRDSHVPLPIDSFIASQKLSLE